MRHVLIVLTSACSKSAARSLDDCLEIAGACPIGRAWADIPSSDTIAHGYAECSNMGTCQYSTGTCKCSKGFTGSACERSECPNGCSGHGRCVSIKSMQKRANAEPFGHSDGRYGGLPATATWDEDRIYGCVCDSSWAVGYGSGETQAAQYFGADCS